jgi:lipoyl-dependent peroxiredoxin
LALFLLFYNGYFHCQNKEKIMPVRLGEALWEGSFASGKGSMRSKEGTIEVPYSTNSRFGNGSGANPEELIGAAHAGCYSMALASLLNNAGFSSDLIKTRSRIHLEKGISDYSITHIVLFTDAKVPGISSNQFQSIAQKAAQECPVSKMFNVPITLEATLLE